MNKKKTLRKKGAAPTPVVNFMPRGYQQGDIQKMTLVAPEDAPQGYPAFSPKCLPGTYFRMDGDVLNGLVTVMPDGVHVAWVTCGRCLGTPKSCICKDGMIHTRGLEWIYIRTLLWKDGVVSTHGERYSSDHAEVQNRALFWYAKKKERGISTASHPLYAGRTGTVKKSLKKRGETAAQGVLTGKKSLRKAGAPPTAVRPANPPSVAPAPSLGDLNVQASSKADALLDEFGKATKKKSLRKKDERGTINTTKKTLRKKGK